MSLALSDFKPLIGQGFSVPGQDDDTIFTRLTLVQAAATGRAHPGREEPFSLVFEGPRTEALDQATYFLEHEAIGSQPVFLVPISEDAEHRRYEALFN